MLLSWAELFVSPTPSVSCCPVTVARPARSITQPITPAAGAFPAISFSSGRGSVPACTKVSGEPRKTVPSRQDVHPAHLWACFWTVAAETVAAEKEKKKVVCNKFPRMGVKAHRGVHTFLNIAFLHVLMLVHARTAASAHANTRPNDRITNVLHCCVQDLTTREGDLLVLFVRSVAVISRVPRRGRPAGSHLPPTLPLPVPAEEPGGRKRCNRFQFHPTSPPPALMSRAALAEATVVPSTSFPLSLKMNDKLHY